MKISNFKNQKGFTLIELLLYVLISSSLLLSISIFLFSITNTRFKNRVMAEVEGQGVQVMEIISQNIRNASLINSPSASASSSSLSLNTYTPALNPTLFSLASGVIEMKEGALADVPLTNNQVIASNLSFHNLSYASTPGIIRISFTLSFNNTLGRQEFDYSKDFISSFALRQP